MNRFGVDLTNQIVVYLHPRTKKEILVVCVDGFGCIPQTNGTKIRVNALRCQDDTLVKEMGMIRSSDIIRIATQKDIN